MYLVMIVDKKYFLAHCESSHRLRLSLLPKLICLLEAGVYNLVAWRNFDWLFHLPTFPGSVAAVMQTKAQNWTRGLDGNMESTSWIEYFLPFEPVDVDELCTRP
jgi:hypothetical protein